jgi:4-hydroxy-2-oxoheptanedioate aldolase
VTVSIAAAAIRERWAQGRAVAGPFIQLPAPASVEIAAQAGFDFVAVDLEHGPYGIELAEQMVRAADARRIAALVRVQANRPELIAGALQLGAAGVLVPHVDSVADAQAAVAVDVLGKDRAAGRHGDRAEVATVEALPVQAGR